MKYYHLKSAISSNKSAIKISQPVPSFQVSVPPRIYVEPTFEKVFFETERPAVVLISAVGASGKTALAQKLSSDLGMPRLDLSKHKPVGDKTLTGLLTDTFELTQIGHVLTSLANGQFGIIVDGLDEGRSKTNESAFEAFLDDLAKLVKGSPSTTLVLLGRSQIVDECWSYLTGKGIDVGVIGICPFSLEDAKQYVDLSTGNESNKSDTYRRARDEILSKLGTAFVGTDGKSGEYLNFIGYPPVLDSIATTLRGERNYFGLLEKLKQSDGAQSQFETLRRIAEHICRRENEEKVRPNILHDLLENAPSECKRIGKELAFSPLEQAARLVAHILQTKLVFNVFPERVIQSSYEERLETWVREHPYLDGTAFRNAVFEAYALVQLLTSTDAELRGLAIQYLSDRKHTYHLLHLLESEGNGKALYADSLNAVIASALEFKSPRSSVEIRILGEDWEDAHERPRDSDLDVEVEVEVAGKADASLRSFDFRLTVQAASILRLGRRLGNAEICVPCGVSFDGGREIELHAPLNVEASRIELNAPRLVAKGTSRPDDEVALSSGHVLSRLDSIEIAGTKLEITVPRNCVLEYPAVQYAIKRDLSPSDKEMRAKYFRLKRILMEFRSHKKGSLAKYRHKIEHERVLKNEIGEKLLAKLVADGVLVLRGEMYHLDRDKVATMIGSSWQSLRKGEFGEQMENYLRGVR